MTQIGKGLRHRTMIQRPTIKPVVFWNRLIETTWLQFPLLGPLLNILAIQDEPLAKSRCRWRVLRGIAEVEHIGVVETNTEGVRRI